jgi:hypothetical protein
LAGNVGRSTSNAGNGDRCGGGVAESMLAVELWMPVYRLEGGTDEDPMEVVAAGTGCCGARGGAVPLSGSDLDTRG